MGAKAVMRQRRDARPKTKERRRGLHPTVASRDRRVRPLVLAGLRAFRDAYRAALGSWLERSGPTHFPEGTYKMQTYPGVISERAPPRRYQAA